MTGSSRNTFRPVKEFFYISLYPLMELNLLISCPAASMSAQSCFQLGHRSIIIIIPSQVIHKSGLQILNF